MSPVTPAQSAIRLVSINIEYNKHLHRVLPFLTEQQPDVVCMQEVFEDDLSRFEETLGMSSYFVPLTKRPAIVDGQPVGDDKEWGIALLSKQPLQDVRHVYYATNGREPGVMTAYDKSQASVQKALLSGSLAVGTDTMRIATTHLTWTPDGHPNDEQLRDLTGLLAALSEYPSILFAGDFNAPRGFETSNRIEARYTAHVPADVTTTIDQNLHRVTGIMYVVDNIFSTNDYLVSDVQVIDGVSDHCALVATVTKRQPTRTKRYITQ